MPDDAPQTGEERRGWGGSAIFGPVLLLIYLLSPGPVVWMLDALGVPRANRTVRLVVTTIYAPVIWLIQNVEWIERFYDWYLSLFGVR
jgi:hypothetical protein